MQMSSESSKIKGSFVRIHSQVCSPILQISTNQSQHFLLSLYQTWTLRRELTLLKPSLAPHLYH